MKLKFKKGNIPWNKDKNYLLGPRYKNSKTKFCNKCKKFLLISEFYRQWKKAGQHGYHFRNPCKKCMKEWCQEYNSKNKEYRRKYSREYLQKIKKKIFDHYGNECKCCGETNPIFLTLDHIDGDGAVFRRKLIKQPHGGGGNHTYHFLIKNNFPEGFQTLCFNCNYAKFRGGCPHLTSK